MAGHSKWANIKHKKAAADAKRGKVFTRISKEISVAARVGGGDATGNPRLRHLIDKARDVNMPLDNVARAIKRGTGELPGVTYESIVYEGYGPHGIAIIVEALTDNKNRTVADMRRLFSASGGSLAETNAVNWMFSRLGVLRIASEQALNEEALLENLIDFDVKDISIDEKTATITTEPKSLEEVKKNLQQARFTIESAELEWVAQNDFSLPEDQEKGAIDFLEKLEEHEDVQNIYTNLA